MWKLYKYNGSYIMGDLISSHKTESAAMKKAKKELTFKKRNQLVSIFG